jgi:hypothetical protein
MSRLEAESGSDPGFCIKVAVKSLRREGDKLRVVYTFRWADGPGSFLFRRPECGVKLYFWDAAGEAMGEPLFDECVVDGGFMAAQRPYFEMVAAVTPPAGAKFVAVELGSSGILTKRVPIPD